MMEWKEVRLGDVLEFHRGYDLPKSKMTGGDIPVAGSNGIIGYHSEETNISPCITIGRSGSTGIPYYYEKAWAHNTVLYISDFKGNDPLFLYYLIKTLPLGKFAGGSAVPSLNRNHIHPLQIKFPTSLSLQRRISSILTSLDRKIELNHSLCQKLEEMASTLFRAWFIDFLPFKNQELIDSPLGRIPKGWKVGTLGEIGDVVGGGTPSKAKPEYYTNNGIAWLTPKDLSISNKKFTSKGAIDITQLGYDKSSAKLMPKGSVLFSSRAPIGYITIALNDICTNQGFKSVVPTRSNTPFVYYVLKTNTTRIENMATGSTFKEASATLIKNLSIVIPSEDVLSKFNDVMKPIFEKQMMLEAETLRLTSLRDTLLPRLMSGELEL